MKTFGRKGTEMPVSEIDQSLHLLFPTVVRVSELSNHQELKSSLLAEIETIKQTVPSSKPQFWACDLYTTIGAPHTLLERPGVHDFLRAAEIEITRYARALSLDIDRHPLSITECWVNVYGAGHAQEIHIHRNSVISGIYYLQAPPGSGATLFYSPMGDVMLEPPSKGSNGLNAKVTGFPPVEGRMILFRSSVRHSVLPSRADGERITIAFNAVM